MRGILCSLLMLGVLLGAGEAAAQTYPSRPIKIIVPFPPGGGTDVTARAIGQKLSEAWGQSVVVENRTGASGMIGADAVAKSAPDGYTLLMASPAEIALNPALYSKMTYDPAKDLAPVVLCSVTPLVFAVHASVPANTFQELIALARAKPGTLSYGSSGTGSSQHLTGEWFRRAAGVDVAHIPYKGGAAAVTDLVGGQIPLAILGLPPLLPHIKAGRLKALAVSTPQRNSSAPEIPTLAELGYSGFDSSNWFGLLAPAGTPRDIIDKLNAEVNKALKNAEVKARLATQGADPLGGTPEEFAAFIRAEIVKYAKVIRDAGVRIE